MSTLTAMTDTAVTGQPADDTIDGGWEWIQAFYDLNIDRFLEIGWTTLGVLTVVSCVGMVLKLLKSNRGLQP